MKIGTKVSVKCGYGIVHYGTITGIHHIHKNKYYISGIVDALFTTQFDIV